MSRAMLHGSQAFQDSFTCLVLVTFCNSNYSCLTAGDWFDIMYMNNEWFWKDIVERAGKCQLRK